MRKGRVSFAVALPVLELLLWAAMIALPMASIYARLGPELKAANGKEITVQEEVFSVTVSRDTLFSYSLYTVTREEFHLIAPLNLPGSAVEILISLPTTWPEIWHPDRFDTEPWRSMSLPFYCLPFWWFAGLGIDAWRGRRRLAGWAVLLGSAISGVCLLIFVGMGVLALTSDRTGLGLVVAGALFWAGLFGFMPWAWFRQRKRSGGVGV